MEFAGVFNWKCNFFQLVTCFTCYFCIVSMKTTQLFFLFFILLLTRFENVCSTLCNWIFYILYVCVLLFKGISKMWYNLNLTNNDCLLALFCLFSLLRCFCFALLQNIFFFVFSYALKLKLEKSSFIWIKRRGLK